MPPLPQPRILTRGSYPEHLRVGAILRQETTGGVLLMVAAAVSLIWANSPAAGGYFALRDLEVGVEALHLRLSLGTWAADGLLAIFFFLVGLELKHEFVAGDLREPVQAGGDRPGPRRPGGGIPILVDPVLWSGHGMLPCMSWWFSLEPLSYRKDTRAEPERNPVPSGGV